MYGVYCIPVCGNGCCVKEVVCMEYIVYLCVGMGVV